MRIRTLILCLFAVFAVSATAASTASAHRTWWRCHKVTTKETGEFTESLCATKSTGKKGEWESEAIPTATPQGLVLGNVTTPFVLKASGEEITCETVTLSGGTVENILVEGKGPTGRDKGTIVFSKNCRNLAKPGCVVEEPETSIKIKGIEVKGKETALVENIAGNKIYELFTPKGWTEAKPEEFALEFATIKQTGTGCVATTKVEGNGVAAEIIPEGATGEPKGYSVKKTLNFPCPPIKEIINWKGATVKLKLKAFVENAEECGAVEIGLASGEAFDVR